MELFNLTGKNAIVIGGSRGLGYGMAAGLSQAGARVMLVSRNQEALDQAKKQLEETTGGEVLTKAFDICSVEGIRQFAAESAQRLGQIDILINSAGLNIRKAALDFEEEDWDRVQDVQLKYVFFMAQAVARQMVEKKIPGKIINIASLNSVLGLKNMVSYCAAKGGIAQMTKAMANELAPYGICVNAIGPGYFETEMTKPLFQKPEYVKMFHERIPMNRTGLPEDLAGAAVFLASPASDYMTGQIVYVDGGWLVN